MPDVRSNSKVLLEATIEDIKQDLHLLLHISYSLHYHLNKFTKSIKFKATASSYKSVDLIKQQYKFLFDNLYNVDTDTNNLLRKLKSNINEGDITNILAQKKDIFNLLRILANLVSNLITSTDWQSPSYMHSLFPQAGKFTGKIKGTINDYKRDVHLDAQFFESLYKKEYLDSRFKFNLHVYVVNSGMVAFTTILTFLLSENKAIGKIMIGENVYFQYKQILVKSFQERIIEVDESETNNIINTIKKEKPRLYFFDSLCNSHDIHVPDLVQIIAAINKHSEKETYIVIDNTCLSIFQQLFRLPHPNNKIHLIVFESLNKYYQFGLDRVTAGVIAVKGKDASFIYEYRKHAGTIISDSSVYAIPIPSRKLLTNRLLRLERNASQLATFLENQILIKKYRQIDSIIYPNLASHSSYPWTKSLNFHGSFFNIKLAKDYANTDNFKKLISIVLQQARKAKIQLVAGTSFGLDNTRIYLTSLWTDYGAQFLRVAVGTESYFELEILKQAFINSFEKFD